MHNKFSHISFSSGIIKAAFVAGLFVASTLLSVGFAAALAVPLSLAWNAALVPIAKVPSISWGEAFALLVLEMIVFGAAKGVELSAKFRE